jgi:hypothetical protein
MEKRGQAADRHGKIWVGTIVRFDEAEENDFLFWYEGMSPDERVNAVSSCMEGAIKTRGDNAGKRLRRVFRIIKRK